MPDQIGWFFDDRRRTRITSEGIAIGGLLRAHAGRGGKVVREHLKRDAVIVAHDGAVQHAGKLSPDWLLCEITRCDPSGKVISGSKLRRLMRVPLRMVVRQ